jgi:hypothetical protein
MTNNEAAYPDKPLNPDEQRTFKGILDNFDVCAAEPARAALPSASSVDAKSLQHLFSTGPSQRELNQRRHQRAVWGTIGALSAASALLVGGYSASRQLEPVKPTVAEIKAAAFKDANVLRATGTCAPELAIEGLRLAYKPTRGNEQDTQNYPYSDVYVDAQALALHENIDCVPPNGETGTSTLVVRGISVTVSGGSTINNDPTAVSLLDFGSDVKDTCIGIAPGMDEARAPDMASQVTVFRQLAEQYCLPTGE